MMEFPKIHSLYKRQFTEVVNGETRFLDKGKSGNPLIIGEYAQPEFANIQRWHVEEKIDGTNIRIGYKDGTLTIGGRTEAAQIPTSLVKHLQATLPLDALKSTFPEASSVILFGEGYGPKIQSGGYYSKEVGFVLFDVWVDGWWLQRSDVYNIAHQLHIPSCPVIGVLGIEEIVDLVKQKPNSKFAAVEEHIMEGFVCRPDPLMLYRNGKPIVWKLKCKDFA